MMSEEGVRATPRINEAIRAGIKTFDKNADDKSGSTLVINAFISISYSPPADAEWLLQPWYPHQKVPVP